MDGNAARNFQALGVIGDPGVFIAFLLRRNGHLLDGISTIARCRMRMKLAANILERDQIGQRILDSALDFIVTFSELRLNKGQAEFPVQSGLGGEASMQSQRPQTAGNGSQLSQVSFGPRTRDKTYAPISFAGN